MTNGTVRVALLVLTLATGWAQKASDKAETLARWHFAGVKQLKELKSQKALQAVLDLPQTAALRQAGLGEIARQAAVRYSGGRPAEEQRHMAAGVQEMLGDLLDFESKFLMTRTGTNVDWVLAAKLPAERAGEWQKKVAALAKGAGLNITETPSWSAAKNGYHLGLARQKDWTVLSGGGAADSKAAADFRKSLDKKAGKAVVDAEFNFPLLGQHFKAERLSHAPRIVAKSTPNKDGFRSEVQLEYAKPLGIKAEKWSVPKSIIRDPVVGFTAIQGLREALARTGWFAKLQAQETPNQVFVWSMPDSPFSSFIAADVGNPAAVVTNVMQNVLPKVRENRPNLYLGQPQFASNRAAVILRGLPVVVPFVEAGSGPASEFLVAGLFPTSGGTNQAPAELFRQLEKKNLVYYEWEITEERLRQLLPITQLIQIIGSPNALRSDTPSTRWIEAIAPKLGNTITEGTLEGDRRIRIVRQSHVGMNALELAIFAHWLDPNDFRRPGAQPGQRPAQRPGNARRNAPPQTPQP